MEAEGGGTAVKEPPVEETAVVLDADGVAKLVDEKLQAELDTLVERVFDRVQELLAGEENPLVKRVLAELEAHKAAILEAVTASLDKLTAEGVHAAEGGLGDMVTWAHQKIDGLITAVERGVGLNVSATLPPAPGEAAATQNVEVVGAEKAS